MIDFTERKKRQHIVKHGDERYMFQGLYPSYQYARFEAQFLSSVIYKNVLIVYIATQNIFAVYVGKKKKGE